jgi:hypothetical protein
MKKLLTVTLGLALAFACVTPTFAQDAPKKEKKSKGSKTKKTKKGDKKG